MSKQTNNRIITNNKSCDAGTNLRKCAHHIYSHYYAANIKKHDDIIQKAGQQICAINLDDPINIKILIHFLSPLGTYNRDRVRLRAHDIIMSLNDDFNNYTSNKNAGNNFKYKTIVNQVFGSNMGKQNIYLGQSYLNLLPSKPSNITFELGEVYYYPVKNRLGLAQYDDTKDIEIQAQVIKQYIHQNRADAINPEHFINIWIIDMTDTSVLGYSNFPWEIIDNFHGIIINRRCFFPEDYGETNYSSYKTFTHEIGHYLGLLHVGGGSEAYISPNINAESESIEPNTNINDIYYISDPLDKSHCKSLHTDAQYNPLFMNFMDFTHDKYVSTFTCNQIQKMRYMINTYRPKIDSTKCIAKIPMPKYNPDTNTVSGVTDCKYTTRTAVPVPSYETVENPRMNAQNCGQNIQSSQSNVKIHPDYAQYIASQSTTPINTPKIPEKISQPKNIPIHLLAPNLCGFEPGTNTSNNIIENIQNNIPAYEDENIDKDELTRQQIINNYKNYNSDSGYASRYPYDPYTTQEYLNNLAILQKYNNQQSLQSDPVYQQMYQQTADPRLYQNTQIDPKYLQQYPQQFNQQYAQQYPQQQYPQQQYYQVYPQQQYSQPNTQQQYSHQNFNNTHNLPTNPVISPTINSTTNPTVTNVQQKRIDPQFLGGTSELSKNLDSDINTETENYAAPSNLINRINNLDNQIRNIKNDGIIKQPVSIQPTPANVSNVGDSSKYNKYGQSAKVQSNNFIANKLKKNENICVKPPKSRFQRTRPNAM
ncbi:Zinc-dependent metalloprotease domain containing protein [Acanthamoeba polyphaga moumouvirus]|uniref:Zinc-dependent metalloprotease domain containing protein n=1 Tax=Acanthamoeba polyphaga moumouvirus TaxID=1269028 RepID=L7RBB6_9VIRU|nr:Zinc-dependent metalloprotease domain containing protein [Acanthamoeba polyphaga moumouvirus]AGC01749.1 Zinc-dependent metalloprotease domain containing protein [Acanthamoeba polyphaga moumouvirus]AQN68095.1 zinc-dependent metalloprotease domain containing protein [Saudi moumouvirus]